ncbi:hypothetical protein [Gimesia aquarii]|nr:hypothetical protein [Gimesia aquarii]
MSAHQAPSVLSQLEDKMDGLGHYAALGAKTAAADARHDLARAFIF